MKEYTLGQIAALVGGELHGDHALQVINADIIRDGEEGFLTFAEKSDYFEKVAQSDATSALIPTELLSEFRKVTDKPCITVPNVAAAFTDVVKLFRQPLPCPDPYISSAASVDETAQLGNGVTIEPGAAIGPNVVIGDGARIYSGANIMSGSRIGSGTQVFPNAVLYENTVVGNNCVLHANCVIGCYGFGYESSTGSHFLSTQLGNVEMGDEVEIGAGTTIDRATYGSTTIGEGTKIDNQVQIGHNCKIGKRNLICALVGIAGSCTTGDNVVMAGQVGIGDHVNIGHKTVLGAKSGVMADIPEGKVFFGAPATPAKQQMTIVAATHRLPEMRKKFNQMERDLQMLLEMTQGDDASDSVSDAA